MNDFEHAIKYYPDVAGFGYTVSEIVKGEKVLRVVSPARWRDPWTCGMRGLLEAINLRHVAAAHAHELEAC